jgi:MFS family permease
LPSTYWYLCVGIFVNRVGNFVLPFLAIYFAKERGFSVAATGVAVATYGAGSVVATLVGGALADRFGRRRVLLFSLFVGPIVLMALPFANDALIVPLTFALGAVYELYRPAANAAIVDLVPAPDRQRAFAIQYWGINLGFAIGVTLGGLLATRGYLWLFALDAATTFLYGIVVYLKVPETSPGRTESRGWLTHTFAPFRNRTFAAFLFINVALASVFNLCGSMLPIEMTTDGIGPATYGRLIAINGALIVCLQPAIAAIVGRFQDVKVMAAAALVLGLGFGATGFVSSASGYAATIVTWTLAEMAWLPIGPAIVAALSPVALRGAYQGAYGLSFALSMSLAPFIGGLVFDRFGSRVLWSSCTVIGALCASGFLLLAPSIRRRTVGAEA